MLRFGRYFLSFIACSAAIVTALPAVAWAQSAPAIETLKTNAANGDRDAQYRLGAAYELGTGLYPDAEKAAYWYQKSAAQCDSAALDALGQLYLRGAGVDLNRQTAAQYFRLAAAQHNPAGLYDWGIALMNDVAFLDEAAGDAAAEKSCPTLDVAALKAQMSLKSSTGDALYSADPAQLRAAGIRYVTQAASLGDPRAKAKLAELHAK